MTSSKQIEIGDLVWMPRLNTSDEAINMIGVVVEKPEHGWHANHRRIGVFWADGSGIVDFEPIDWLRKV